MSFVNSDAIFPGQDLADVLGQEYEAQCRQLCFGPYPSWNDVLRRFVELREHL
jgi:hypothetical protein